MTRITGEAPWLTTCTSIILLFSWRATLSQIIALSTAEAELMALASCCCKIVWARKLAIELGFPLLKPTDIYEDNSGCIALADNMHLRGRFKHIALRVCFIHKLIQNGLINVKQCPTALQTADIGTKAWPRIPFENFTDQLLGDKHVGDKRFLIRPFLSHVCQPSGLPCFIYMSLSCFASAYLLSIGLGDL